MLEIILIPFEAAAVVFLIFGFVKEKKVVEFEKDLWSRAKKHIAERLRKSESFMEWLTEPTVSQRIDADYKPRTAAVRTDWRNNS